MFYRRVFRNSAKKKKVAARPRPGLRKWRLGRSKTAVSRRLPSFSVRSRRCGSSLKLRSPNKSGHRRVSPKEFARAFLCFWPVGAARNAPPIRASASIRAAPLQMRGRRRNRKLARARDRVMWCRANCLRARGPSKTFEGDARRRHEVPRGRIAWSANGPQRRETGGGGFRQSLAELFLR